MLCAVCRFWTVVPCRHSTTPLLSVTVSYVVITETLFCLTPFPLFLQVIMPRGRRRGRGRGRLAHTDIVSRPEVTLLGIYIARLLGCTSFCIYWMLFWVNFIVYVNCMTCNVLFWLWYSIVPAAVIIQELSRLICQVWLVYMLFPGDKNSNECI